LANSYAELNRPAMPTNLVVLPDQVGSMLPTDKRPQPAAWSAACIRASGPTAPS
jgi:hypothetical protein